MTITVDEIKEKLLKLSHTSTQVQIVVFNSEREKIWFTGLIMYNPEIDEKFHISDCCGYYQPFEPERVLHLNLIKDNEAKPN